MPLPPPSKPQARVIWLALTGLAMAVIVGLIVALVWGLGRVLNLFGPVLWPLAIAGVLAYLLDPVVDLLERRRVPRPRGVALVFFVVLLLIVGIFGSVIPQLVVETRDLASRIPTFAANTERRIEQWATNAPAGMFGGMLEKVVHRFKPPPEGTVVPEAVPGATNLPGPGTNELSTSLPSVPPQGTNVAVLIQVIGPGVTNAVLVAVAPTNTTTVGDAGSSVFNSLLTMSNLKTATSFVSTAASAVASWLLGQVMKVTSLLGVVAGMALVPIYLFYFLVEKRSISAHWTEYLPVQDSRFKEELVFVLNAINGYLIAFFRGQVLVAICDGVLYGIGFSLIGLPYAVLIGVLAIGLTIIPYLGAFVTVVLALVLALVQFGDWQHPLLVLAVFAVVQTLEGFVIQPKIMGDRVGLHPVVIIIALMAGTTLLGGLLGGILAIPLAAALRVVMFRYIWRQRDEPAPPSTPRNPKDGKPEAA